MYESVVLWCLLDRRHFVLLGNRPRFDVWPCGHAVSSVLLDDVASCRLEFCKSRLPVCAVCRSLGPGEYV